MGLLLPLVLCALAACCGAVSLPQQYPNPSPLLSRGCNNSDVLAVAGFALQDINNDRKDGYVLSLDRVNDVREHRQDGLGSLFYLTLDVLETDCHVLSRKAWKDCRVRSLHQSVYGQCKAMFYINKPGRVLYLPAFNCTLRPVSRRKIHRMCPDCPSPTDLSDPRVLEAATESLAKFNNEGTSKQYSLIKVTRASSQPVGLCKGSLVQTREKLVSVTCDFFKSQATAPGGENSAVNQEHASLPKVEDSQKKDTTHTDSPSKAVPRGSVQYLPDLDDEKPEDSQEKGPHEAFPVQLDLTTNPQGDTLDVSFLFLGPTEKKLVVLPFPKEEQRSAECPGPAQKAIPLVLPP
ncbi:PREDICTED: fetuin-B-like [Galeopterus variegatus]|uniref:Fetuin-B-like n=1 Tax=Galeopterus variegatus TaxID=482537 RepID=A0ABM0RK13_GALVR|nr:PREDICTED: fetuin-B-like [Galeopterus variegatus]